MSRAFSKARVEYYLGQGKVWSYPAVMVVKDYGAKDSQGLRPLAREGAGVASVGEGLLDSRHISRDSLEPKRRVQGDKVSLDQWKDR